MAMSDGYGYTGDGSGRDPYAADPYASDPYAADPYASGPHAPSGSGPDPYASAPDPYALDPAPEDPFSQPDPLHAPGFRQGGFSDTQLSAAAQGTRSGPTARSGAVSGHGPYQAPLVPQSSGKAIAGMVLGLVSLTACGLTAPIGLVLSILGMRETSPDAVSPLGGRGMAIAGLVCSIIGSLGLVLVGLYFLFIILVILAESV